MPFLEKLLAPCLRTAVTFCTSNNKINPVYDYLYFLKEQRTVKEICGQANHREDEKFKLRGPASQYMYICGRHLITGTLLMLKSTVIMLKVKVVNVEDALKGQYTEPAKNPIKSQFNVSL